MSTASSYDVCGAVLPKCVIVNIGRRVPRFCFAMQALHAVGLVHRPVNIVGPDPLSAQLPFQLPASCFRSFPNHPTKGFPKVACIVRDSVPSSSASILCERWPQTGPPALIFFQYTPHRIDLRWQLFTMRKLRCPLPLANSP